jgi:hypothetical protein
MDWMHLAYVRDEWQAHVYMAMNFDTFHILCMK